MATTMAPLQAQPLDPAMQPFPWESWDEYRYRLYREQENQLRNQSNDQRQLMNMQSQLAADRAGMAAAAARQRSDMAMNQNRNLMQLSDLQLSMAFDKLRDQEPVGSITRSYRNSLGSY